MGIILEKIWLSLVVEIAQYCFCYKRKNKTLCISDALLNNIEFVFIQNDRQRYISIVSLPIVESIKMLSDLVGLAKEPRKSDLE